MSHHNLTKDQSGFTLFEMIVTIALIGLISATFFGGLNSLMFNYFRQQKTATQFSDLAFASQRVANVLRGTTDFISVGANDVTVYAYFYPNNANVSQIRYYLNASNTALLADVTPMSANPPAGTPVTSGKRTYTIIPNYFKAPSTNLFTYLDASGNALTLPISDQHVIKGMSITLAVPKVDSNSTTGQTLNLNVSLRNRKTNL